MFVKKLVEKATKKPGENSEGLKASDVEPRMVFHYGIPSGASVFAYDSIQKIIAISTKDGRIKLFGRDNTQALLESDESVPSTFLKFMENQGTLLNVTFNNHIEVWDIDKKLLSSVYVSKEDITSFTVMQHSPFIYVGDSSGNIKVLKLDQDLYDIVQMKYTIPFSACHGSPSENAVDTAVVHIMPHPTADSKRVLIIYRDGHITLWDIRESRPIFSTGGNVLQSVNHEAKKVTSACWACPFGTKVVLGYSNGDIFIWSIPSVAKKSESTEDTESFSSQSGPLCKLNLGLKLEKIPVASLRWAYADGKASRLYVMGESDSVSTNILQVVLLNDQMESRTVKLGLHVSEPCTDMEITSGSREQSKRVQDTFLLLGKSGHIYAYNDCLIEKYLLQFQSRTPPSDLEDDLVKIPISESTITVAKFFTNHQCLRSLSDEEYIKLAKNIPPLITTETKQKDGTHLGSNHSTGLLKGRNIYITGHSNGAINFWDASCPVFLPILSLKMQSEDDFSLSGIPLTALYFNGNFQLLISGDQSGMVRIFKLKPESHATESVFTSLQASSRKGNNHIIHSIKLTKVNGSVLCLNVNQTTRHLAVGTDQGHVYLIDMEGPSFIYEKQVASEICNGIISLQFEVCNLHGFDKKVLAVATKDSSVLALDSETGNQLSSNLVHPKKPSKALFMQILDGQDGRRESLSNGDMGKQSPIENVMPKQALLLLCSEKAAYVYSLSHIVQGVKKVHYKKKFHNSCCFATTFYTPSHIGVILLFSNGKIEIRSLPELSLIKETSLRGFTHSTQKPSSIPESSFCSSSDGELVIVNGNQEMFLVSNLLQNESFRNLDYFGRVYNKGIISTEEAAVQEPVVYKEKKKGIFNSVIKDIMGSKGMSTPNVEIADPREFIEELAAIFSIENFKCDTEDVANIGTDEDLDLDIDDIDLDGPEEKPKEQKLLAALNKQNLASKFHAFKGKLKQMKVKSDKSSTKEEQQDEKIGSVDQPGSIDQIKKRYGYTSSSEASAAKMAENKLRENLTKLQGINQKTSEMQHNARSFSSMAKEVLRIAEQDK